MKHKSKWVISFLALAIGATFGMSECQPMSLVTIVSPADQANLEAATTTIVVQLEPSANRNSFIALLNNRDISKEFEIVNGVATARAAKLIPGKNVLQVSARNIVTKVASRAEISFVAGPNPVDVRGDYLIDIPFDFGPMAKGSPLLDLTFFVSIKTQNGFFADGFARLVKVNGELLTSQKELAPFSAEVLGDKLDAQLYEVRIPIEDLLFFIIDPMEEWLNEDIDPGTLPVLTIKVRGKAEDSNTDNIIDTLAGEVAGLVLNGVYEIPQVASFTGLKYLQTHKYEGSYLIRTELGFMNGEAISFLNLTYAVQLRKDLEIGITGAAQIVKINDNLLTSPLKKTVLAGLAVNDEIAFNIKSFDVESSPYLVELLTQAGIPAEVVPTLEVNLFGEIASSNEQAEVTGITGDLVGSVYGGIISTPAVGHFDGSRVVPTNFGGPRVFEATFDLGRFDVYKPINASFCFNLSQNGLLLDGEMQMMTVQNKAINLSLASSKGRGTIIDQEFAINMVSLALSNEEILAQIESEIEGVIEGSLGYDYDLTMPKSIPIFDLTARGSFDESMTGQGTMSGTLFGLQPVGQFGQFTMPPASEISVSNRYEVQVTIDTSTLGMKRLKILKLDLSLELKNSGCAVTGKATLLKVNGLPVSMINLPVFTVKGIFDGTAVQLTIFEIPVEYLEAAIGYDIPVSGPLFDLALRGNISESPDKAKSYTIGGEAYAGFVFDIMTFAFGTFSAEPTRR